MGIPIGTARRADSAPSSEGREDGWKEPHVELPVSFLGRGFTGHRVGRLHGARLAPDGTVEVRVTLTSRLNGEDRSVMVRLLSQGDGEAAVSSSSLPGWVKGLGSGIVGLIVGLVVMYFMGH